ncbi:MAG: MoaD/ThiS family protein [Desulfobacterales bacterium]|nr:MoaD/ThiS family protein [Desulfobacterales bacterium]
MPIIISINLFASLGRFTPPGGNNYSVDDETTVQILLEKLGVPLDEAKLVFVNGIKSGLNSILKDGDRVGIFPPVGGG